MTDALFVHDTKRRCPKCNSCKWMAINPEICAFCGRQKPMLKDWTEMIARQSTLLALAKHGRATIDDIVKGFGDIEAEWIRKSGERPIYSEKEIERLAEVEYQKLILSFFGPDVGRAAGDWIAL